MTRMNHYNLRDLFSPGYLLINIRNNFEALKQSNLINETSLADSLNKIKQHPNKISYIDQNITATGGYTEAITINNQKIIIDFPTALYDWALKSLSDMPKQNSELDQLCCKFIKASVGYRAVARSA